MQKPLGEIASYRMPLPASTQQREAGMNSRSMAGWIGFAGIVMVILGGLSFFEGLIALARDNYFVPTDGAS